MKDQPITITVDAVYEDGVLKLLQPLPLDEHASVEVTVNLAVARVRATAGLFGWTGTAEELDEFLQNENRRDEELPGGGAAL